MLLGDLGHRGLVRLAQDLDHCFFCKPGLLHGSSLPEDHFPKFQLGRKSPSRSHLFDSLNQVRDITESWLREYNEERPHDSLGRLPPLSFMPRQTTPESTVELCA